MYIYIPVIDVFFWARSARDALKSAKSVLERCSSRNVVVGFCWRPPDEEEEAFGEILGATGWARVPQYFWNGLKEGS